MKRPHKWMLTLMPVLLIGGCAMPTTPVQPPPDRRVTIGADLARDVVVTDIRCVRGTGGFLNFQAEVVNHLTKDCGIEWRIAWLDASGLEVESVSAAWRKLMVPSQDIVALTAIAPNPSVVDFRIYLRKLRD